MKDISAQTNRRCVTITGCLIKASGFKYISKIFMGRNIPFISFDCLLITDNRVIELLFIFFDIAKVV